MASHSSDQTDGASRDGSDGESPWQPKAALSAERLGAIIASLDVIVWEFDAKELVTTYVSPTIERILGYSMQATADRPKLWQESLHPDDREEVLRVCREHTRHGHSHELDYRLMTDRGESLWVHDIATYIHYEDSPDLLRCVISDISEQKQAQTRIETNQRRLAEAQRIAKLGDWTWYLASDVIECSDEVFRIFGIVPQSMDLTFERVLDMIPAGSASALKSSVQATLQRDEPYSFDYYITMPDGEPRIVHTEGEVVCEEGEPVGMRGTVQDITGLRRAEALYTRLGRILEHSLTEVIVFDGETLEITQANRASRANLGYGPDELTSMSILDVLESIDSPEALEKLTLSLDKSCKETVRFTDFARRKDGSEYPVVVRLLYSGHDLDPVYAAILEDISSRETVDRLKEEFLGLLSHELRTPLTPLMGLLDVIDKEIDADEDPRLSRMINLARTNGARLRELVEELLDLQRLSTEAELALDRERTDLAELVCKSVAANREIFTENGISYTLDVDDEPVWVRVDRARVRQVVTNLMSNAMKFSPSGGHVDIEVYRARGRAHLDIRDYGKGIDESFQPHMFGIFTQGEPPMKRSYSGAGLGLALTKLIVEKHGGEIAFESARGEGTTFCIILPLAQEDET